MSSNDTNAFDHTNGAVFGNPTLTPAEGSADDWQSMSWDQLEAAILGGSEMTTQAQETQASGISSPATLQSAADVFYTVQQTLAAVAEDMQKQAGLLAGQDGSPWQGPAAQAFMAMIKTFVNDINANVSLLQDAAGNSVPDQLINNANTLAWAQQEVQYIDSYWANIAVQQGAQVIDGKVQVHEVPAIPPLMTADMKQVMSTLVMNYSNNTYPTAVQPQTVNANNNTNINPNYNTNYNTNVPDYNVNGPNYEPPNYPNVNIPNINIPNYSVPNYNGNVPNGSGIGDGNLNTNVPSSQLATGGPNLSGSPNLANDALSPSGVNGSPNLTGSGLSPSGLSGSPSLSGSGLSPSGVNGSPNLTGSGLSPSGLSGSPSLSGSALGPSGLSGSPNLNENALSPSGLAVSPSLSGSPNLSGELPNYSALNPTMDNALNPNRTSGTPNLTSANPLANETLPNSESLATSPALDTTPAGEGGIPFMPGVGAGSGAGQALSSAEPSDASGLLNATDPFSGESPLTSDALGSNSGAAPGLTSAGEGGIPFMPGVGAGSGAGQALSSAEPSDASGLLNATDPFSGESPLTSDALGSDSGAAPGLTSAGEGGIPFVPETGAGSGAGQALSSTEPSDASGLLGGESEPWSEEGVPGGDEVGSLTGAAPGLEAEGARAVDSAESGPDEEMPIMPGTGVGQAARERDEERSDASGLLGGESEPWTEGEPEGSEEVRVGVGALAAVGETAWLGAGAGAASAAAEESAERSAGSAGSTAEEQAERAEPAYEFEGDEYEYGGDDGNAEGHEPGGDRVPVVGTDGSDDDLSGWDLAGAAADAALFTLGAWAERRRSLDEGGVLGRTVSTEQEAWLGEDADLPSAEEEADGLPMAATWRPNRDTGGSGESRALSAAGTMLRSAPPPKDYDPVAAAEAAAAEAEAEEAERQAALEAEEEERRKRVPADLLIQDPDMWGSPKADWDAL